MKTRIRIERAAMWFRGHYYIAEYKKHWFHRKWERLDIFETEHQAAESIDKFLKNESYHGKIIKYPPNQ